MTNGHSGFALKHESPGCSNHKQVYGAKFSDLKDNQFCCRGRMMANLAEEFIAAQLTLLPEIVDKNEVPHCSPPGLSNAAANTCI